MKKYLVVALALAAVLAFTPAAKADSFSYAFTGTAPDAALTGSFNLQFTGNLGTGGSITFNDTVHDFVAGTYSFSSGAFSPDPGFATFVFTGTGGTIDLLEVEGTWQIEYDLLNSTNDALAAAPEPSSLLLLGSGLLILALGIFWKSKSARTHQSETPQLAMTQLA